MKYGRYLLIFMVFFMSGCSENQSNETPLFIGLDTFYVPQGSDFNSYETLVSLSDYEDGDIPVTVDMINTRNVNLHRVGEYPVYYTYTDSDGNKVVYRLMMHVLPRGEYYQALIDGDIDRSFTSQELCIETLMELLQEDSSNLSSQIGNDFYEAYYNKSLTDTQIEEDLDNLQALIYTTNTGLSILLVTYEEFDCIKIYDALIIYNDLSKAVEAYTNDETLILTSLEGPLDTTDIVLNQYLVENDISYQDIEVMIEEQGVNPDSVYVYETSWEYNEYAWDDCILILSVDGFYIMLEWI